MMKPNYTGKSCYSGVSIPGVLLESQDINTHAVILTDNGRLTRGDPRKARRLNPWPAIEQVSTQQSSAS